MIHNDATSVDPLDAWTIGYAAGLGNHPNLAYDAPTLLLFDVRDASNLALSTAAVLESLGVNGINMKPFLRENLLIVFIDPLYINAASLRQSEKEELVLVEFTEQAFGQSMELGAGHSRLNALKKLYAFLRAQFEKQQDAVILATRKLNKDGLSDKRTATLIAERKKVIVLAKEAETAYFTANRWGLRFVSSKLGLCNSILFESLILSQSTVQSKYEWQLRRMASGRRRRILLPSLYVVSFGSEVKLPTPWLAMKSRGSFS